MHVLLKNYLLYFFGILLIIWLSESLIHSFIQLFGYLFDFKKTNFFISLLPRLWILQKDRLGVPDHLIHAKNAHVPEWQRQWLLLGRKSWPFLSSIRKQFIAFVPQGISIKNDLPESLTRSWFDFYENIGADLCLAQVKSRAILGSVLDIVI